MFRNSLRRFSNAKAGRTIIRDPRKKKAIRPLSFVEIANSDESKQNTPPVTPPIPFAPLEKNQESVGSVLGSYVLAGVGVTMGFALVKVVFGI